MKCAKCGKDVNVYSMHELIVPINGVVCESCYTVYCDDCRYMINDGLCLKCRARYEMQTAKKNPWKQQEE